MIGGLAGLLVVGACVVPVPPHGWRADRGPVLPHDTFPADCGICHVTGDWHTLRPDFTFDHTAETGWPLAGGHFGAECLLCHNDRGPAGVAASRGCGGCHEDPHQGHLGALCESCHFEERWRPREAIAAHASTRFPLTGAHAVTACFACHPGAEIGNFQRVDTRCASCHRTDAAAVKSPDHLALGWTECQDCHRATSFADVRFAHPPSFPLRGGHAAVACATCHGSGPFSGLSPDCQNCHMDDFGRTTDPDHAALGFSVDCASCHRPTTWRRARFDHTTYPLRGAHRSTACSNCHTNGTFAGTPRDCVACHRSDFDATTDPGHAAAGFPTECDSCHTSFSTWRGALFDHATYQLRGAHRSTDCTNCHGNGVFAGTPRDCVACHQDDFDATSDPNHAAANFPATCDTCHTSFSTWRGADFSHTFPIDSGDHRRLDCNDCHESPNFANFTCVSCHEHSRAEMNDEHDDVRNYVYVSSQCFACHPRGEEDDD